MALSAQDLLAIREHQLAYDTLAKGTLDSTLNELKSVLADITSATDLDSLKKELEDKKITLDKQEEILYNNAQVQQDEYNNNINTIKEKNRVLDSKQDSLKEKEQQLENDKQQHSILVKEHQDSVVSDKQDLAVRLVQVQSREEAFSARNQDLLDREAEVARKLAVLKAL